MNDVNGDLRLATLEDVINMQYAELRVQNGTPAKGLATAILRYFDEGKRVRLSCIGAQAVAQAMKGVAVANGELGAQGKLLAVVPAFETKMMHDKHTNQEIEITAIQLIVGRLPVML